MLHSLYRFGLVVSVSIGLVQGVHAAPAGDASNSAEQAVSDDIVEKLRVGGYVIYFRHAATDHGARDTDISDPSDCSTQRRLSNLGRQQAVTIGKAFEDLEVPVGSVVASPLCRTRFTAELAFGRVETDPDLLFSLGSGEAESSRRADALKRLLSNLPEAGLNNIIAGHTANLRDASGVWPKPEGAAIVFRPNPNGGFDYIGAVHPDSWARAVKARVSGRAR